MQLFARALCALEEAGKCRERIFLNIRKFDTRYFLLKFILEFLRRVGRKPELRIPSAFGERVLFICGQYTSLRSCRFVCECKMRHLHDERHFAESHLPRSRESGAIFRELAERKQAGVVIGLPFAYALRAPPAPPPEKRDGRA